MCSVDIFILIVLKMDITNELYKVEKIFLLYVTTLLEITAEVISLIDFS